MRFRHSGRASPRARAGIHNHTCCRTGARVLFSTNCAYGFRVRRFRASRNDGRERRGIMSRTTTGALLFAFLCAANIANAAPPSDSAAPAANPPARSAPAAKPAPPHKTAPAPSSSSPSAAAAPCHTTGSLRRLARRLRTRGLGARNFPARRRRCRPASHLRSEASSISTAASAFSPRPFWNSPAAWPPPTASSAARP